MKTTESDTKWLFPKAFDLTVLQPYDIMKDNIFDINVIHITNNPAQPPSKDRKRCKIRTPC